MTDGCRIVLRGAGGIYWVQDETLNILSYTDGIKHIARPPIVPVKILASRSAFSIVERPTVSMVNTLYLRDGLKLPQD